jgi:hypothetical protein
VKCKPKLKDSIEEKNKQSISNTASNCSGEESCKGGCSSYHLINCTLSQHPTIQPPLSPRIPQYFADCKWKRLTQSRYLLASCECSPCSYHCRDTKSTQRTFQKASLEHTNHKQHTHTSTAQQFSKIRRNKTLYYQHGISHIIKTIIHTIVSEEESSRTYFVSFICWSYNLLFPRNRCVSVWLHLMRCIFSWRNLTKRLCQIVNEQNTNSEQTRVK